MKKKFAFILMGAHYQPELHQSVYETETQITYIYTVRTYEEARERLQSLAADGVGAVELCGAFGEDKARELIGLTNHKIAVGYVTHTPEQDDLFDAFFSKS